MRIKENMKWMARCLMVLAVMAFCVGCSKDNDNTADQPTPPIEQPEKTAAEVLPTFLASPSSRTLKMQKSLILRRSISTSPLTTTMLRQAHSVSIAYCTTKAATASPRSIHRATPPWRPTN